MITTSIIIPTFNRARSLERTLSSLREMTTSSFDEFEVIVVDNNSIDETPKVIEKIISRVGFKLQYVLEKNQGTNYARNRGIMESKGNLLVFTDDDVEFSPNWLTALVNGHKKFPNAWCLTGKVQPTFESGRPDWLKKSLLTPYGLQDYGQAETRVLFPQFPVEMNMAIQKEVINKIGLFSTAFNRNDKTLMSNDGKIFFHKIAKEGGEVIYLPDALLYHLIPADRSTKSWLLKRIYWQGISDVAFEQAITPHSRFNLLREAFQESWELMRRATGKHLSPRKAYWHYKAAKFPERLDLAFQWGRVRRMIEEAFRFSTS